jgi:hypothetical protein
LGLMHLNVVREPHAHALPFAPGEKAQCIKFRFRYLYACINWILPLTFSLGRVSLRGAAQVRVAALLAITGQPGADPGDFRRGDRGTQDEWDRARGDAFAPRAG